MIYQDLEDLQSCAAGINEKVDGFDCSVFNGEYVTEGVSARYLERIEQQRNDQAKQQRVGGAKRSSELHNYH